MPIKIVRSMDQGDQSAVGSMMNLSTDRRKKPRVDCDYPVVIEGYDTDGNRFKDDALLVNLSAGGLYMKSQRVINIGSAVSVTVLLTTALVDQDTPKLATNGIVVRVELQPDGTCGIAVKFNNYRFL